MWTYKSLSSQLGYHWVVRIDDGWQRCERSLTGFRRRNGAIDGTVWVRHRAMGVEDKKALRRITLWVEYATSLGIEGKGAYDKSTILSSFNQSQRETIDISVTLRISCISPTP